MKTIISEDYSSYFFRGPVLTPGSVNSVNANPFRIRNPEISVAGGFGFFLSLLRFVFELKTFLFPEIKLELRRRRDRDRDRRDGGRPGHGGGGVRRRDRREPGPPAAASLEADPQREGEEEQRKPIILAKSER
jgi:hypothetical protein